MSLSLLNIEQLEELVDANTPHKYIIEIFLLAINDWPTAVLDLQSYVNKVEQFIRRPSTKKNIAFALNNIDISKNAWQSESLYQILDVFQHFRADITLREIIEELK